MRKSGRPSRAGSESISCTRRSTYLHISACHGFQTTQRLTPGPHSEALLLMNAHSILVPVHGSPLCCPFDSPFLFAWSF